MWASCITSLPRPVWVLYFSRFLFKKKHIIFWKKKLQKNTNDIKFKCKKIRVNFRILILTDLYIQFENSNLTWFVVFEPIISIIFFKNK